MGRGGAIPVDTGEWWMTVVADAALRLVVGCGRGDMGHDCRRLVTWRITLRVGEESCQALVVGWWCWILGGLWWRSGSSSLVAQRLWH